MAGWQGQAVRGVGCSTCLPAAPCRTWGAGGAAHGNDQLAPIHGANDTNFFLCNVALPI